MSGPDNDKSIIEFLNQEDSVVGTEKPKIQIPQELVIPPDLSNFLGEIINTETGMNFTSLEDREYNYHDLFIIEVSSRSMGNINVHIKSLGEDNKVSVLTRKAVLEGSWEVIDVNDSDGVLVGEHSPNDKLEDGKEYAFYNSVAEPMGLPIEDPNSESFGVFIRVVGKDEQPRYFAAIVKTKKMMKGQVLGKYKVEHHLNARTLDVSVSSLDADKFQDALKPILESQQLKADESSISIESANWRDCKDRVVSIIDEILGERSNWNKYADPEGDKKWWLMALSNYFPNDGVQTEETKLPLEDGKYASLNFNQITTSDDLYALMRKFEKLMTEFLDEGRVNIPALYERAQQPNNDIPDIGKENFPSELSVRVMISGMKRGQFIFRKGENEFFVVDKSNPSLVLYVNPSGFGGNIEFLRTGIRIINHEYLQEVARRMEQEEEEAKLKNVLASIGLQEIDESSNLDVDSLKTIIKSDKEILIDGLETTDSEINPPFLLTAGMEHYIVFLWNDKRYLVPFPNKELISNVEEIKPDLAEILRRLVLDNLSKILLVNKINSQKLLLSEADTRANELRRIVDQVRSLLPKTEDVEVIDNSTIISGVESLVRMNSEQANTIESLRKEIKGLQTAEARRKQLEEDITVDNVDVYAEAKSKVGRPVLVSDKDVFVLGRGTEEGADILHNDDKVSRRHAKITRISGKLYVEDLDSSNGTFVGDTLVQSGRRILLEDGNILKLGTSTRYEVVNGNLILRVENGQVSTPLTEEERSRIEEVRNSRAYKYKKTLGQVKDLLLKMSWRNLSPKQEALEAISRLDISTKIDQ